MLNTFNNTNIRNDDVVVVRTDIPFDIYTKKCNIKVTPILCNRTHPTSKLQHCEGRGFAHSKKDLLEAFYTPEIMKYFEDRQIIMDDDYVLSPEKICCSACKADDSQMISACIHIHDANGIIQSPKCVIYCNHCRLRSSYYLYVK